MDATLFQLVYLETDIMPIAIANQRYKNGSYMDNIASTIMPWLTKLVMKSDSFPL